MAVKDELLQGSWRGIPFDLRSDSENFGFKGGVESFADSDNFTVTQRGKLPRQFSLNFEVTFEDRDRMDSALKQPGKGLLVHPMAGNFICKLASTDNTKSHSINRLGLYEYSAVFIEEVGLSIPTIQGITDSVINQLKVESWEIASDFIEDNLVREFSTVRIPFFS